MEVYFYCSLRSDLVRYDKIVPEDGLILEEKNTIGEICEYGKNKGGVYEFNYIRFALDTGDLSEFLRIINKKEAIREAIALSDYRELHVLLLYEKQCNWEFSEEELSLIHILRLTLTVSCDLL